MIYWLRCRVVTKQSYSSLHCKNTRNLGEEQLSVITLYLTGNHMGIHVNEATGKAVKVVLNKSLRKVEFYYDDDYVNIHRKNNIDGLRQVVL